MSATLDAAKSGRPVRDARKSLGEVRALMGLTQHEMSRMLEVSTRTIASVEKAPPAGGISLRRKINEVERLHKALAEVTDFSAQEMRNWFLSPNEGLGGSTPLQVIERGEIDRVWRLIYRLEEGALY